MNQPRVAEPTIGVVAGDTYYYVANSFGALLRSTEFRARQSTTARAGDSQTKIG